MPPSRVDWKLLALSAAVALLLAAFDPGSTWWFPSCPLRALTGWLCPFCGTLRAAHALLHGDLRTALALNAPITVGLLAGVAAFFCDLIFPVRASRFERGLRLCASPQGVALLTAFAVLRNIVGTAGWASP
jgi:Protein of unknown function (DUF2752)